LTSGRVHSRLVDFGNPVECKTTELCSAAYVDFPSQSFYCRLDGADERPPGTVARMLREYESKKPLVLAVRHKTSVAYFVDLVDSGKLHLYHIGKLLYKYISIYLFCICSQCGILQEVSR